jgi:Uma2 family endonuclease
MGATEGDPRPIRWTGEEFWRLYDAGLFADRRVELIGGEIVEMAPQRNFHAFGIQFMDDALTAVFSPNFWVRVQMSLDLSPDSIPDPDLAVIAGSARAHLQANRSPNNPTSALLFVEVSETTLAYDRGDKMSLYAASGIADYWVLNIPDRQLEVYRNPVADASQRFGFRYAQVTILQDGDFVSPLAASAAQIAVADVLV